MHNAHWKLPFQAVRRQRLASRMMRASEQPQLRLVFNFFEVVRFFKDADCSNKSKSADIKNS
jgi:hypothetical protein